MPAPAVVVPFRLSLPASSTMSVRAFASACGGSLFPTLLAAYKIVLLRQLGGC